VSDNATFAPRSKDAQLDVVGVGQQEFPQHFPRSGWVEHLPLAWKLRASKWTRKVASLSSPVSRVRNALQQRMLLTHGWQRMRVRLKGFSSKRKQLADGSYETYWYA